MHEGHNHDHELTHDHEHTHDHGHSHDHQGEAANMPRELALLRYMLEHNRQHAEELSAAGAKLRERGAVQAAELISAAAHYFDHGNDELRRAVELLNGEE